MTAARRGMTKVTSQITKELNKMNGLTEKVKNCVLSRSLSALSAKEDGDHLLEVLGVIIIAVVLLIFFRGKITEVFQDAIDKTATNINALWGNK